MSADFVAHMEDVLDLYAEPYDPARPVVCFDETSTQLLADARPPIPAKPGRPRREDYEYVRGGTRNLFLTCEPLAGWRHVEITERHTKLDFAHQMRWLVEEAYPEAEVIRVCLTSTTFAGWRRLFLPVHLLILPPLPPLLSDQRPAGWYARAGAENSRWLEEDTRNLLQDLGGGGRH